MKRLIDIGPSVDRFHGWGVVFVKFFHHYTPL